MALKTLWEFSTLADRLIIVILVAGSILSFQFNSNEDVGAYVVIEGPDGVYSRNPLSAEASLAPDGRVGKTVIQIKNSAVRVVTSACPLKICVSQGSIDHIGELIACVPNGILVYVEAENGKEGAESDLVDENRDRGYDQISR